MSEVIKIKRGLDIRQQGKADTVFGQAELPELFAIKPTNFHGLVPKLAAKVGDKVKAGTVLFYDKYRPEIKFVSPVSGELKAVNRGERRRILEVVVQSDKQDLHEEFGAADVNKASREEIIEKMLAAGVWPFIRQRPYDVIANPADTPKAFFISGFDSAPLAPDYDFILSGQEKYFQAGIDVLRKLSGDNVHVGINDEAASKVFNSTKGITLHRFQGPHPAGNVGIQIHHVSPLNKGEVVWVTQPQEVLVIGKLFAEGIHDASRIVVLAGSEVEKPAYYRTKLGASISTLIKNNVKGGKLRYISGNVLTGKEIENDGYIGSYDSQVTVIPEGDYYEFMGWALPGLGKYSVSRSFFSWMCSKKEYQLDSNMHGGKRAIVVSGQYDKVLPMDILPEFLFKAILVEDIDKMEQLGIYEVAEEDVALCEFVCTSKMNLQGILRQGIDLMIKELG
ncbi:Na(+)-translocating NADH-quinone reductase subunit A [Marinilabiliaceae bacterium JC017]|nr:Na(+)-translocating NADH-quinone reductase subunit A [Marinilabiliaceae bacterium JC017]